MRWDTNSDGRLDPGELDAIFNEIQAQFCNIDVMLNKIPISANRTMTTSVGLKGHTDSQDKISISLQFQFQFPKLEGASILTIEDHPRPGTHCPVVLQMGKKIELLNYSGRMLSDGLRKQILYVLDQKHRMAISFKVCA